MLVCCFFGIKWVGSPLIGYVHSNGILHGTHLNTPKCAGCSEIIHDKQYKILLKLVYF